MGCPPRPLLSFQQSRIFRIFVTGLQEHGVHAASGRATQLAATTIADIEAALRRNAESLTGQMVDAWVRLEQANPTREDRHIDKRREGALRPEVSRDGWAVADQASRIAVCRREVSIGIASGRGVSVCR